MNKKTFFALAIIFTLGLILRLLYFDKLTFEWDQARDAFSAISIWTGDPVKIIGANTDIPGVHHGPLYWYFIAPFYFFGHGNPLYLRLALVLLSLIGIYLIYKISDELFKNNIISGAAALIFAVSTESVQYARWMSNPAPALITTALTYLGIWRIWTKKRWGVPLTLISFALSIHFQFLLLYHAAIILPLLIIHFRRNKFKIKRNEVLSLIFSLLILSTFLAAEFKFGFQAVNSLTQFLTAEKSLLVSFTKILAKFIDRTAHIFYFNIFSWNMFIAGIIALFTISYSAFYIYKNKKYKHEVAFLLIWLFLPVLVFAFDSNDSYYTTVGSLYPVIILFLFFITEIFAKAGNKKFIYFILLVIVVGQTSKTIIENAKGERLFAINKKMILRAEVNVMDWIYKDAGGSNFALNTITNPLYINTTWGYLFNWYGKSKYGYMPSWWGYPQNGQFGSGVKYSRLDKPVNKNLYLIIEKQAIPKKYEFALTEFEGRRSEELQTIELDGFLIQKRRITVDHPFSRDEVNEHVRFYEKEYEKN